MPAGLHHHTPSLKVMAARGLSVRSVTYWRGVANEPAQTRVERTAHDTAGRLIAQWDPRMWAQRTDNEVPAANFTRVYALSGTELSSNGGDAGLRLSLFGEAGQICSSWDGRGSRRELEYDDLLRPLRVVEQAQGEEPRCTERYCYANAEEGDSAKNQCGRLVRHDDTAGTRLFDGFSLTGAIELQTQHFLQALNPPDWRQSLLERDALHEPGTGFTTITRIGPLGDVLVQRDAKGNQQYFSQTRDGALREVRLQLEGQLQRQMLVSEIRYNAHGGIEREVAGNGVVSALLYRPEDGRLSRLQAQRSGGEILQDLRYDYDPKGNVVRIEDAALPVRYFGNQRIDPISAYAYDSLDQLIDASGWEAGRLRQGPAGCGLDDPAAIANYRQTYRYDASGNLLELVHVGVQSHGRLLTASRYSNRCLPQREGRPPSEEEIAACFDANGNLRALYPGQMLHWDVRNQLQEVRPLVRTSGLDDCERYIYDAKGQRVRKISTVQAGKHTLVTQVRYLPGLEVRSNTATGEAVDVINVNLGRGGVRVLHWQEGKPEGIVDDQYRYSQVDHLGSCALELDGYAAVVSREGYYPFGATAWFSGRKEVEASYKTVRYSGKERDATGLYYYGLRYYICWLQRWTIPDPAGRVDGLNLYCFVLNSPVGFFDRQGLSRFPIEALQSANVRSKAEDGDYVGAQRIARKEQSEDVAVINEWVVSLMPSIDYKSKTRLDSRTSNTLYQAQSETTGLQFILKDMQSAEDAQREELAYRVSEKLKFHLVPPTKAKVKSMVQQMVSSVSGGGQPGNILSEQARFFYFLINETDDNAGNQLWDEEGGVFLIDHESSFSVDKNKGHNLSNIDVSSVFDEASWKRFKHIRSRDWRQLLEGGKPSLPKSEIKAFVKRVGESKIAMQRQIDKGKVNFGRKRNFFQKLLRKKVA